MDYNGKTARDVAMPTPEVVSLEHELAEATHILANATERLLDARREHNEAAERYAMLLSRVDGARKEAGS